MTGANPRVIVAGTGGGAARPGPAEMPTAHRRVGRRMVE
jgi:hypothetical protein